LARILQRENYDVVSIHGDLKQADRERHLEVSCPSYSHVQPPHGIYRSSERANRRSLWPLRWQPEDWTYRM
jgi:hypothetical protein